MKKNWLMVALLIVIVFFVVVMLAGVAFGQERYNCSNSAGFSYAGFYANRYYNGSGVRGVGAPCRAGTVSQTMRDFRQLRREVYVETFVPRFVGAVIGDIFTFADRQAERDFLLRLQEQETQQRLAAMNAAGGYNPHAASAYAAGQSRALAEQAAAEQRAAYDSGYAAASGHAPQAAAFTTQPCRQVSSGVFTQFYCD